MINSITAGYLRIILVIPVCDKNLRASGVISPRQSTGADCVSHSCPTAALKPNLGLYAEGIVLLNQLNTDGLNFSWKPDDSTVHLVSDTLDTISDPTVEPSSAHGSLQAPIGLHYCAGTRRRSRSTFRIFFILHYGAKSIEESSWPPYGRWPRNP